jgi:hypothetical protein
MDLEKGIDALGKLYRGLKKQNDGDLGNKGLNTFVDHHLPRMASPATDTAEQGLATLDDATPKTRLKDMKDATTLCGLASLEEKPQTIKPRPVAKRAAVAARREAMKAAAAKRQETTATQATAHPKELLTQMADL